MKQSRNSGFTIIELLIATAVFSVVLLVISAAIIQIGRLYYKGITSARTQEVARSVMNDISQAIQFNVGQVEEIGPPSFSNANDNGNSRAICVATQQYNFVYGQQRTNTRHALVSREVPSGCLGMDAQAMDGSVTGNELLGDKMRLANLVVERQAGADNAYKVTVRVVYGDSDLLCDPSATTGKASCTSTDGWNESIGTDAAAIAGTRNLSCKNIRSGTQFCAASELSTIVKRRLVE
ncbi:MAG TPA: type II secretion system protein [Candidatus Saccharimonadales bacterium]